MKLLLILGISILYYQIAHSEYIYKYSVDTVYRYNGGKLITIFDKDLFVNYYFQNDFGSATFSISKWYGLEKKGAKGISRNNYNGIDYLVCESRVVVLLNDDEFIKLAIFDNNLNLLYEIVVDGLTKKTNLDNYRIFKLADRVLIKSNQKILFHSLDLKKNIDSLELTSDENIFPMDSSYLILKTSNSTGLITMYDYKNKAFGRNNLIIYDTVSVKKINDLVFISTSSTNSIQTLLQVINYKTGQIELLKWLDSEINNVDFTVIDNTFYLTYVKQTFSANKLIVEKFTNIRHIPDIATTLFPSALIEPQNTKFIQNKIITLLKNGIFGTYLDGTIILSEQFHASELEQINSFNSDRLNYLILNGTNRN